MWRKCIVAALLIAAGCMTPVSAQASNPQPDPIAICSGTELYAAYGTAGSSRKLKITDKERNRYFSKSAFIGSSIGVGLKNYVHSKGKGYMGNPVMLVQGCYSFANDKARDTRYKVGYKGRKYRAKDAVKAAKVKRVFISMGTNDLWKDAKSTGKDYIHYVEEIRKENPGIVVFIESTTPMCSARCRGYLNNSAIDTLNEEMKKYCERKKDVYYVNVFKGMKDAKGGLKGGYSSDGYVHLNGSAYALWIKNLTAYVDDLLLREKVAKQSVAKASKSRKPEDYEEARKKIMALESSTVKDKLRKQWKGIRIEKEPAAEENVTHCLPQ